MASIGGRAFQSCTGLTTIELPNGITSINGYTFFECSSLKDIVVPSSVTTIVPNALENCISLENIIVSDENETYMSIDGILFSKDASVLYRYPAGRKEPLYVVPDHVVEIYQDAFQSLQYTTCIEISDSVTEMGWYIPE